MGHGPFHPPSVQTGQAFRIVLSGEHLRLEPAHRVGACCLSFKASLSNDDPHSWVLGQPFSVVGVLIASKTAVYRLPEQSHQLVLDVAATPALLQTGGCCLRQSQGIIQLAAGQESGVRGNSGAVGIPGVGGGQNGAWCGCRCFHPLGASGELAISRTRLRELGQASTLTSQDAHLYGSNTWSSCRLRHAHGAHLGNVG